MHVIKFDVKEAKVSEVRARARGMARDLRKLENPHAKIAVWLDSWVQRNFKSEGGNVGGWQKLKAGGRKKKGKAFDPSAQILQDTGRLRSSFFPFHSRFNAGIASDLDYSEPHEKGLNGLPVRRMLPKQAEVKTDIRRIYDLHVKRSLRID